MPHTLKTSLWKQFGASIDMLENAIRLCPTDHWNANTKLFYNAYHCLVFLDYYLTIPPKGFSPALPFTLTSPDRIPTDALDDLVPDRIYAKDELLDYVNYCREKCRTLLAGLTQEQMESPWTTEPDPIGSPSTFHYSVLEILLYNMRHVQHHAAQLNLLLRQGIKDAPSWVSAAKDDLEKDQ
jgi:hypothetical protein